MFTAAVTAAALIAAAAAAMSEITFLLATGQQFLGQADEPHRGGHQVGRRPGRAAQRVRDRAGPWPPGLRGVLRQPVGGGDLLERGLVGRGQADRLVGEAVRRRPDPAHRLRVVPRAVAEPGDHRQQRGGLRGLQRPGWRPRRAPRCGPPAG